MLALTAHRNNVLCYEDVASFIVYQSKSRLHSPVDKARHQGPPTATRCATKPLTYVGQLAQHLPQPALASLGLALQAERWR
jgi:hypothetical protein